MLRGVTLHCRKLLRQNTQNFKNLCAFVSLLHVNCFPSLSFNLASHLSKWQISRNVSLKRTKRHLLSFAEPFAQFHWVFLSLLVPAFSQRLWPLLELQEILQLFDGSHENGQKRQNFRNVWSGPSTKQRLLLFNRYARVCCMAHMENNIKK